MTTLRPAIPALLATLVMAGVTPAAAQSLAASVGTTASSATLSAGEDARPTPTLHQRRALAMAAFERPPGPKPAFARTRGGAIAAPVVEPRDEWFSDEGFRVTGPRVAYKARF